MDKIEKTKIILNKTKSVRDFLVKLRSSQEFDIKVARFFRSTGNLWDKMFYSYHLFGMKRNLKKINAQIEEFITKRLEMRAELLKPQYLQRDLKLAVKLEEYEQAAIIRDEMRNRMVVNFMEKQYEQR